MAATATMDYNTPIYTRVSRLTDKQLAELKTKLVALRRLHEATGFAVTKEIVNLLSRLSPDDLVALGLSFPEVKP